MNHTQNDKYLIERIQPQGGVKFSDSPRYITSGGGYETCIHIYEFPKEIDDYWLADVCNINGTVVTVDIATDDVVEVKKNLNKSIQEQNWRSREATNFEEAYDAELRKEEMKQLFHEISAMGQVIKLVHVRIYVADRSRIELEEKVKTIMEKTESNSFLPTIYLNEGKTEWKSMYQSYSEQKEELFFTYGQPLTSDAIAAGDPFHFSSLEDECGTLLGTTACGGNVLFNLFTKTKARLFYNFLCIGTMGSGKSTLLKKQFDINASLGNYVRAFDISGEFTLLTKKRGGKVINLDGSNGILNPLEILRAGDDETISFTRHISKVSTIYKFLTSNTATTEEIITFEELLREMYRKKGFEMKDGKMTRTVTGLPADQYPIFSDFLAYIVDVIKEKQEKTYEDVEKQLVINQLVTIDKIRLVIANIVKTYGNLFNGKTSIDNILDEQIVTFNISTIKNLKPEIFDALLFNMVSLCWDNCVVNGKIMMQKLNDGMDIRDVVNFLILIDESHRWLNAKKSQALDQITLYLREARKYFGGIGLASQSIRDYVPEGSSSAEQNKIKTIFELTQYKFLFHQDSNVVRMMNDIFDGVLTSSQISKIPKEEVGECILSISSDKNIDFKVYLTEEENELFQGGI
jgi:hypothetical protein